MPLKGQFEQQVNAIYAERLGFATNARSLDTDSLRIFLKDAEKEYSRDDRILWPNNERFFSNLDNALQTHGIRLNLKPRMTHSSMSS